MQAVATIVIAFTTNLIFKFVISAFAGSRVLARAVDGGFIAMTMDMGW